MILIQHFRVSRMPSTAFSIVTSIKQQHTDGRRNWMTGLLIRFSELNEIPYHIYRFNELTYNSDINVSFTLPTYISEPTCVTPTLYFATFQGRKPETRTAVAVQI